MISCRFHCQHGCIWLRQSHSEGKQEELPMLYVVDLTKIQVNQPI